jgi:hypothetical protein
MSCSEEFEAFLTANPGYTVYNAASPEPDNTPSPFGCSNGEVRYYYIPQVVVDCDVVFQEFLAANLQYEEIAQPAFDEPNYQSSLFNCSGNAGSLHWYTYTPLGCYNAYVAFLAESPDYGGITEAGRIFFYNYRPYQSDDVNMFFRRGRGVIEYGRIYRNPTDYYMWVNKRDYPND